MAPIVQTGPLVEVSRDGLRVTVRAEVTPETLEEAKRSILSQMHELHLCEEAFGIDLEALLQEWLTTGDGVRSRLLFEGTPPGPPTHGELKWSRDFFIEGFELDEETDRVDYRKRLDNRGVAAEELLCTLTEAIDGAPGRDVYGKPIRGPRARRPRIRTGPNVRSDENVRYYAERDGRIRWHRATLSVDDVYVIEDGVNLRSGNIQHPGTLIIYRDVERGCVVIAEKDVEVHGMIDGASVQAGGDIVVHGGIVGHADCKVSAGGSVRAAYLLDARVSAGTDVEVTREIVQSQVAAQGRVAVAKGRIAGGSVRAGIDIAVGELGTDGEVRTIVAVAEPTAIVAERVRVEAQLNQQRAKRAQIVAVIEKLDAQRAELSHEKLEALVKLSAQLDALAADEAETEELLAELKNRAAPPESRIVRILRRVHAEVSIGIDDASKRTTHAIDGPLTARLRGGEVRIFADDVRR